MPLLTEHSYSYAAHWHPDEIAYIATVTEFPSLFWLAADAHTALVELQRVVRETLAEMKQTGETPPQPVHLIR